MDESQSAKNEEKIHKITRNMQILRNKFRREADLKVDKAIELGDTAGRNYIEDLL